MMDTELTGEVVRAEDALERGWRELAKAVTDMPAARFFVVPRDSAAACQSVQWTADVLAVPVPPSLDPSDTYEMLIFACHCAAHAVLAVRHARAGTTPPSGSMGRYHGADFRAVITEDFGLVPVHERGSGWSGARLPTAFAEMPRVWSVLARTAAP